MRKYGFIMFILVVLFSLSCTDLVEELEDSNIDLGDGDSLINVDDSIDSDSTTVDEDTITNDEDLGYDALNNVGLHYSEEELKVWKERSVNGPYKAKGDAGVNTPGDWYRIMGQANNFMDNPNGEYYYGSFNPEPHYNHHGLRDAAFVYLLTGDKSYGNTVKGVLLKQISIPDVDFSTWEYFSDLQGFAVVDWVVRLLYAYDYTKDLYTASEKERLNKWFYNAAKFYADNVHWDLAKNFPERYNEDYTVLGRDAKSGRMEDKYAYTDKNGVKHNQIPTLARWYNNRRSSMMKIVGLVGAFLNDQNLIHHAKIYVKEMLKYGTFADGTQGEYERNGDWGNPQQGLFYSSINIETMVLIADALAREGDNSLYEYTTSDGMHGTEGGNKSIYKVIRNFYEQALLIEERYHESVVLENRLDLIKDKTGRHWVNDIWFCLANRYYKDDFLRSAYTRTHPMAESYPAEKWGTAGKISNPWGGSGATMPGYLFMFDDLGIANSGY